MEQNFHLDKITWYKFDLSFFQGYAITVFAYTAHTNIFMIKSELQKPIERRIKKIFRRAVFFETALYLMTSIAGYLSLLDKTPSLIIDRDALDGSEDWFMLVGRVGVFMLMIASLTNILAPCRQ